MSRKLRKLSAFLIALVLPIAIVLSVSDYLPPLLRGVPSTLALVFVALTARYLGFVPAIGATLSLATVLWLHLVTGADPGRTRYMELRLVLFVTGATVIASISRRKEEDAREADEMYRSLIELAPDGIVVSDDKGRILFVNDALVRLVGARDRSELIGRTITDFSHPDSLDTARKRFEDLAMEKAAPPMEVKWITLDGRTIDVETAGVPARKNKRLLLQGFIRDLTERKRAAAKLEETARRMQALFDRSLDPTLFFDDTGRYVDANPAASALLGYAREEIVTMSTGDFAPLERRAVVSAIRKEKTSSRQGEFAIVRKNGEVRDIEYATVANVVPGLHCLFMRDISARKAAEISVRQLSARLLKSQDEERRRIARQLHDTTAQNLVALRMNLALIARSPAASDAVISEPLEESVALTELSIAEIRTLSYVLHPPMIEEAGLLPALRWYAQGFEERSGIKVRVDLPAHLDRLPIELATTLFRIVQEALSNVQRHSGSAAAEIRLEQQPEGLHLEIEDTGRGMPQSLRREDTLLLASGVGIAGMRERVLEHGGDLHIQSRDSGTIVSVSIPR